MATKPTAKKPAAKRAARSLADIDTSNLSPEQIAALAEQTAGAGKRKPRSNANWEVHDLQGKTAAERAAILDKVGETLGKPKKATTKSHKVSTVATEKAKKVAKNTGRDKATVKSTKKQAGATQKNWDGTTERPRGKTITKPTGRPNGYSQELADRICEQISSGLSLRKVCLAESMPSAGTVCRWLAEHDEFQKQYTRATNARADVMFEQMLEISDDGQNDTYEDGDGNKRVDQDVIARSRLRVETRKWMIGKMKPKVYGDKVDVNHGVQPDNPIVSLLATINGTALPVVKDPEE